MTTAEYTGRINEVLRYIGGLLTFPDGTSEWQIGRRFALMPDSERMAYIHSLADDNAEGSRAQEIGWDLRAIVLGWPDGEVAA